MVVLALFAVSAPASRVEAQGIRVSSDLQLAEAASWNARGIDLAQRGDLLGAIKLWREGIDYFPAYLHFYNNIGGGLRRLGYLQEARKWYEACLHIQPTYWTWYNLGLLFEDLRDQTQAIHAHREALALHPEFQPAFEHLMRLEREEQLRRFARSRQPAAAPVPHLEPVSPPIPLGPVYETVREPVPVEPATVAAVPQAVSPQTSETGQAASAKSNQRRRQVAPVERTAPAIARIPEHLPTALPEPELEKGPVVRRPHDTGGPVFVTFDGGADADGLPAILAALRERGVKSTFFLTGQWVKQYPDLARQIKAEGHELGNHSLTHPNMSQFSRERIASELQQTEAVFERVLGEKPVPWFRFPFGAQNRRVENLVAELGYQSVYWDIDTLDWKEPSAASMLEKVRRKLKPGAVILMHCGSRSGAKALPRLLDEIIGRGYQPTMLSNVHPSQVSILSRK